MNTKMTKGKLILSIFALFTLFFESISTISVFAAEDSTFTVAMDEMPTDLIPGWGNDSKTIVTRPIYDPLFDEVKDGIEYKIAESVNVSDDKLTYSIKIADDAIWSDGVPITTEDIEFSIRYNEFINGGQSSYSSLNDSAIELNSLDEKTFEWILPEPNNIFIYRLANFKLIPSHPFNGDETGVDESGYFMTAGMATSGAYEVSEINIDNIIYTARDDYHRGKANTNTVVMKLIGSGTTRNIAFESDEISYLRLTNGTDLNKYKETDGYNIISMPEGRVNYIQINPNGPMMKDLPIEARQAIMLAIDQQQIIDIAYGSEDLVEKSNSILSPEQSLYDNEAVGYTLDIERAQELAESSGLTDVTLTYVYNSDRSNMGQIATLIQQQLATIGVNVQVEAVDNSTFFGKFWTGDEAELNSWDIGSNGWDSMRGSSFVQVGFYLNKGERWGWSEEIVDLTESVNSAPSREEEEILAKELQTKFVEDYLLYPLPYTNFVAVTKDNVSGLDNVPIVPEFGDYLPISVE